MIKLTIRRESQWADKTRRYKIVLDGQPIGLLAENASLQQEISEGSHKIQARIDWCGSKPLNFEANRDVNLVVKNISRGFLTLIFNPRRYLSVELANPALSPTGLQPAG
jgi:hypothetical protein